MNFKGVFSEATYIKRQNDHGNKDNTKSSPESNVIFFDSQTRKWLAAQAKSHHLKPKHLVFDIEADKTMGLYQMVFSSAMNAIDRLADEFRDLKPYKHTRKYVTVDQGLDGVYIVRYTTNIAKKTVGKVLRNEVGHGEVEIYGSFDLDNGHITGMRKNKVVRMIGSNGVQEKIIMPFQGQEYLLLLDKFLRTVRICPCDENRIPLPDKPAATFKIKGKSWIYEAVDNEGYKNKLICLQQESHKQIFIKSVNAQDQKTESRPDLYFDNKGIFGQKTGNEGILVDKNTKTKYKGLLDEKFQKYGQGTLYKMEGQAVMSTSKGHFINNEMIFGTFNDFERSYTGEFKNDLFNLKGNLVFKNTKKSYDGYFREGKFQGFGRLVKGNTTIVGNFSEGKLKNSDQSPQNPKKQADLKTSSGLKANFSFMPNRPQLSARPLLNLLKKII